jgi:hypothetical protein
MYRNQSKKRLRAACRMLLLLLPVCSYGQQGDQRPSANWPYNYVEKAASIPVVREALLDSIRQKLDLLASQGKSVPGIGSFQSPDPRQLKENLGKLGLPAGNVSGLLTRLPAFYSLKEAVPFRKPSLSLDFRQAAASAVYDNGPLTNGSLISRADLDVTATLAGVPFNFRYNGQHPSFIHQDFSSLYKMSFDRESLLNGLKKRLAEQYDLQKLLLKDFDFKQVFHQYAEKKLNEFRQSAKQQLAGSLQQLKALENLSPDEFLYLGKAQLEEKLLGGSAMDSLMNVKATLESRLASPNSGGDVKQELDAVNEKIAAVEQLKQKLSQLKKEFETEGLNFNQLVRYQQLVNGKLGEILGSDQFISDASKNLLKMNGLSRLFLYARELNIGQFSSGWSKMSMSEVLTTGVGGSFSKKNKFIGFNVAGVKPLGWIKDNTFTNSLFEPASSIQALRLGKGDLSSDHNHVSMVNATVKNTGSGPNVFNVIPRNTFVGSYSKKLGLGAAGNVEAEVSKSASQYRNTGITGSASEMESKLAVKYFGADLLQTLSFGLQYQGDFAKANFRPSFFVNYSGMGYSNPASTFQNRGALSYGFQFHKNFLSGKMSVQSRFSKRNTRTTTLDDRTLNQVQNSLGVRYRLSKKVRAGLNWTYSDLTRNVAESKSRLYYSNRINGDLTLMSKLAGKPLFHYMGLGFQDLSIPDMPTAALGKMAWVSSSTNWALPKGALSVNLQMFEQLEQPAAGQGSLLTTDAGWSYVAFKSWRLTTSVNYLNQAAVARQLGLRQTLSASIGNRVNLGLFADMRKDLKTNQNKFLYPNTRGEIELTYKFN